MIDAVVLKISEYRYPILPACLRADSPRKAAVRISFLDFGGESVVKMGKNQHLAKFYNILNNHSSLTI
jgi:hypothetical protein